MTPYDKYKTTPEWTLVDKALTDLIANQDIALTTQQEYVVGYISKQLAESKASSDLRMKVLLSANRALWGSVTPALRGVTVDYKKEQLVLRAYFDRGASEEDKELLDVAMTEMMADLDQHIEHWQYEPIDLAFPQKMEVLKDWVYIRHERREE
jgi:hypothetical protein